MTLSKTPSRDQVCRPLAYVDLATSEKTACLKLCAGTLFVLLLKFGAVLSIISGFLMAGASWKHRLQCIVIMRSFLRLLKLHKLAVCKLDLSRGGLTQCHGVLDHGLFLHRNIPLNHFIIFLFLVSSLMFCFLKIDHHHLHLPIWQSGHWHEMWTWHHAFTICRC